MEQLLEDIQPPRDKVFDDLARELRDGLVCPVLMGAATRANGVLRLLKALRHEAPGIAETAKRLGVKAGKAMRSATCSRPCTPRTAARCRWRGCSPARSATARPSCRPTARPAGSPAYSSSSDKRARSAGPPRLGETVAFGKLDSAKTGDTLSAGKQAHAARGGGRALSAGAGDRDLGQGAQGRRQARPGAAQAASRKTPRSPSCTIPRPTRWCCGARARCICASRPSGSRDRFGVAIERRQPTRRLSRDHPQRRSSSAAGTRSSPAATASSATSCSTSSRMPRGAGLRVRGEDHRRRGAAQLYPVGRGRRRRRAQARAARLSGGRSSR